MRKQIIFNPSKAGARRIDYEVWARDSRSNLQKPFWVELSQWELELLTSNTKKSCYVRAEKQPGADWGASLELAYFDLYNPKHFVAEDWL